MVPRKSFVNVQRRKEDLLVLKRYLFKIHWMAIPCSPDGNTVGWVGVIHVHFINSTESGRVCDKRHSHCHRTRAAIHVRIDGDHTLPPGDVS